MQVFIPRNIQTAMATAPDGSTVFGTLSPDYGVATVTALQTGSDPPRYVVASPATSSVSGNLVGRDITRQTLAVLGQDGRDYPFRIDRNGTVSWVDGSGTPVSVEAYDDTEFFKRTPFDPVVLEHLQKERILIVGVGSVGAPVGLGLAQSGVGLVIAADKDTLALHNCMRHCCGTAYVGWPKPVAFAHFLREQVPTCECIPIYGDIFQGTRERLRRAIEEMRPTRIIAATDVLRIQYLCQRAARHYGIPLMAVWCDNNAVEGEIFMWEPGQASGWQPGRPERGCYLCMRDPNKVTISRSSNFDYSSDDPDSYGGEPALGTFINRINNIASIFMTAWILRDCPTKGKLGGILDQYYEGKGLQYIRLGGPYPFEANGQITAKAPWSVEWYRVLKRSECSCCGDENVNERILFPQDIAEKETPDRWDDFQEV